jgi:arsenate reductase
MAKKLRILFLCTGNSCRSQMAEAFTNRLKGDTIEARSAGVEVHGVNPLAVKAMAEVGIDISHARSKLVDEFDDEVFDYAVTLCDSGKLGCPFFPPPTRTIHHGFDDPPTLAKDAKTEEEAMVHFRRVRDEIRDFIEALPENLKSHL